MQIGKQIRAIREANQLSQQAMARDLGVSRQAISKWEGDKSLPDIENLMYISDLYNVSLDTLIKRDAPLKRKLRSDNAAKKWQIANIGFYGTLIMYIAWVGYSGGPWMLGLAIATLFMMSTDVWVLARDQFRLNKYINRIIKKTSE